MTTTLTMDDELYQAARAAAEAQGKTFSDFVTEVVRNAVTSASALRRATRSGLPVIVVPQGTPQIDPTKVRQVIEEEGF